jgi:hypothetical protein
MARGTRGARSLALISHCREFDTCAYTPLARSLSEINFSIQISYWVELVRAQKHTLTIFINNNSASESPEKSYSARSPPGASTQLQKVHVYVSRYPHVVIPEAEILAAFRELAADETDVYVGTKRAIGYES